MTNAEDEPPVLLLPPSTTSQPDSNGIYPSVDDMDVDSGTTGSDKVSNMSAVSTPATLGRKRLALGLGNMGNTCFMNSTLQCLAHTESLRRYFLSGNYEADLNRDNPLGTGGELATQFAHLMGDMWGVSAKRRNARPSIETNYSNHSSSAVYPRSFKYCLGKHAEQFVGYDQHDSQELATYLLDALHEDTNRVTKKPYVEKPEQGEDELDDVAAKKAWSLHLQREDSKVLENFMGQIKSRLECCEDGCNRVSTTFDPFMYLSVPIPGATDRTMKVTFIPLDPSQRMKNVSLTLNKTATLNKLVANMNEELVKLGVLDEPIPLEDLCPVDVWSHEVFSWFSHTSEIDKIRDSDNTYVYQLRPLAEFQEASKQEEENDNIDTSFGEPRRSHGYKLDLETMTWLNKSDSWQTELEKFVKQPTLLYSIFNPKRGTIDERMQLHKRLENFIDLCHKEISEDETSGLKRTREDSESDEKSETTVSPSEESVQGLLDRCDASTTFASVKSKHDVAILEFCSNKLRQFILRLVKEKKNKFKDGIAIQIVLRRPLSLAQGSNYTPFAAPLVVRIPANMTVFGLREELSRRLARSLQSGHPPAPSASQSVESGESSAEMADKETNAPMEENQPFGSPELLIMRQIPLTYDLKGSYANRSSTSSNKKLGMLERAGFEAQDGSRPASIAISSDAAEKALVSDIVGPNGSVTLDWTMELCDRTFDLTEYDTTEDAKEEVAGNEDQAHESQKATTVLDCIKKYCQMEQLEETEMWYCNRCKKHVQAWKQFHLYRAPPILIVHLKRFHYSASTHRRDKITSYIDFPLEGLDLTELVSHYAEGEEPIYDCYAVSNHYGGLGGGHYTAYTLTDDGTWCHYDDSRVTNNLDTKEVLSDAAYVLYYRRRDVPVGQDLIDDAVTAPMVCEEADTGQDASSDISSNNTAQAGDDDMAVDGAGSAASSRTCSSPMGSFDGHNDDQPKTDDLVGFVTEPPATDDDFPLQ